MCVCVCCVCVCVFACACVRACVCYFKLDAILKCEIKSIYLTEINNNEINKLINFNTNSALGIRADMKSPG